MAELSFWLRCSPLGPKEWIQKMLFFWTVSIVIWFPVFKVTYGVFQFESLADFLRFLYIRRTPETWHLFWHLNGYPNWRQGLGSASPVEVFVAFGVSQRGSLIWPQYSARPEDSKWCRALWPWLSWWQTHETLWNYDQISGFVRQCLGLVALCNRTL